MAAGPPLYYESSAGANRLQICRTLPSEVVQCLQNARFLHLATCTDLYPHVSLMNYTYLPFSPFSSGPTIIMTTNHSSRKTLNLLANRHVSLLVHDWVTHRPPTTTRISHSERAGSPPREAPRSSLASLLYNLNTSALSRISATINGDARLLEEGTPEESYFKAKHLENNTFDDGAAGADGDGESQSRGNVSSSENDGGRGIFIQGEDVRVIVVKIRDGRIADWKGEVWDWCLSEEEMGRDGDIAIVNGD